MPKQKFSNDGKRRLILKKKRQLYQYWSDIWRNSINQFCFCFCFSTFECTQVYNKDQCRKGGRFFNHIFSCTNNSRAQDFSHSILCCRRRLEVDNLLEVNCEWFTWVIHERVLFQYRCSIADVLLWVLWKFVEWLFCGIPGKRLFLLFGTPSSL